jgi:hypothetical protein
MIIPDAERIAAVWRPTVRAAETPATYDVAPARSE